MSGPDAFKGGVEQAFKMPVKKEGTSDKPKLPDKRLVDAIPTGNEQVPTAVSDLATSIEAQLANSNIAESFKKTLLASLPEGMAKALEGLSKAEIALILAGIVLGIALVAAGAPAAAAIGGTMGRMVAPFVGRAMASLLAREKAASLALGAVPATVKVRAQCVGATPGFSPTDAIAFVMKILPLESNVAARIADSRMSGSLSHAIPN